MAVGNRARRSASSFKSLHEGPIQERRYQHYAGSTMQLLLELIRTSLAQQIATDVKSEYHSRVPLLTSY